MILALLLAGVVFREIPIADPVLDVRVADIDADGTEEIIAVTKTELLIIGTAIDGSILRRMPVSPVTIVGRGLLISPKGSLLGGSGHGNPVLLLSPGALDGDGKDDPVFATAAGISTPAGLVEWVPSAKLEIKNAEAFAVEYALPVPAVGNWTGKSSAAGNELILYEGHTLRAFSGLEKRAELAIPLKDLTKKAEGIRRNKVFVRDIDNDGRLDLLLVMAKGSLRMFSDFEVTIWHFPGGRVYDKKRKGFYRPASAFKLAGTLLGIRLFDADGDGDLDLSVATATTSLVGIPTGHYRLFRCEDGKLQRNPTWKFAAAVPLTAFKRQPVAPIDILPDFDGDGLPEMVARGMVNGRMTVRLFRATKQGAFLETAKVRGSAGVPAFGKTRAVMITKKGLLVIEKAVEKPAETPVKKAVEKAK